MKFQTVPATIKPDERGIITHYCFGCGAPLTTSVRKNWTPHTCSPSSSPLLGGLEDDPWEGPRGS